MSVRSTEFPLYFEKILRKLEKIVFFEAGMVDLKISKSRGTKVVCKFVMMFDIF
jgi:hypothetical protein